MQVASDDTEKYKAAVQDVGIRFVSRGMSAGNPSGDRKADFLKDHEFFMAEANQDLRVRTIGGAPLDVYGLFVNVLQRGGVQSVTARRAFKMVARALNLPKSCTSAATVLRISYIDQLYLYEQKFVFGRDAINDLASLGGRSTAVDAPNLPRPVPTAGVGAATTPQRPRRHSTIPSSGAGHTPGDHADHTQQMRSGVASGGGVNADALNPYHRAIAEQELGQFRNSSMPFSPAGQADRERLVAALKCPVLTEVAWALGTLNVLSFDSRNIIQTRQYPGMLAALQSIITQHLDDVTGKRKFGVTQLLEIEDPLAPRNAGMCAILLREGGDPVDGGAPGANLMDAISSDKRSRSMTLQQNSNLFNSVDPIAANRKHCADVAINVLRNLSFSDQNAINMAAAKPLLTVTADVLLTFDVSMAMRVGIMDMWVNIAPYVNVAMDAPGYVLLKTCIRLLDPFLDGADYSRFTNAGEVLARLAASPDRNENTIVELFPELLPRLVDMLGGRDRRYVNAGLAALCNCSAFDWPARGRIARTPRAVSRLVAMLSDPELAPRAALTLLNLAEAPSNRSILLAFEQHLLDYAAQPSPASDTVAGILFDLTQYDRF